MSAEGGEGSRHAWVRIREARNEGCVFTLGVVLEVHSTHRENNGVVCRDFVVYESGTILRDETGY